MKIFFTIAALVLYSMTSHAVIVGKKFKLVRDFELYPYGPDTPFYVEEDLDCRLSFNNLSFRSTAKAGTVFEATTDESTDYSEGKLGIDPVSGYAGYDDTRRAYRTIELKRSPLKYGPNSPQFPPIADISMICPGKKYSEAKGKRNLPSDQRMIQIFASSLRLLK